MCGHQCLLVLRLINVLFKSPTLMSQIFSQTSVKPSRDDVRNNFPSFDRSGGVYATSEHSSKSSSPTASIRIPIFEENVIPEMPSVLNFWIHWIHRVRLNDPKAF